MRTFRNPLLWPVAPLLSETVATGLIGPAIGAQFLPMAIMVITRRVYPLLFHACYAMSAAGLAVAAIALLSQAHRRSFRDNTGSRAACETFGYFSIFAFILFGILDFGR